LNEELDRFEEFDESIRTVVPADHLLEEHQQSIQRPAPRPMTPPPIPLGQVVTRAGRVVNPPKRYGFEGYAPEASMRDAPVRGSPQAAIMVLASVNWIHITELLSV